MPKPSKRLEGLLKNLQVANASTFKENSLLFISMKNRAMNYRQMLLSDKILHYVDVDLQLFYRRVLERELDMNDATNIQRIKKAMKVVVSAYKKQTVESLSSSILFDSQEERCAYVLKHCVCFTSAVARRFHNFLCSNPTFLNRAFQQRQLNLCCVGGGPATDAVAVAKVIRFWNFFSMGDFSLKVSVVDLSLDWKSTADNVVRTLEENLEFRCRNKFAIQFEYLQADLTETCPETVTAVLRAADIITMVYFVSAVNGSKSVRRCKDMLKTIMKASKSGAALFFLDSAKPIHYNSFRSAAHSVKTLARVYGPYTKEFHTLSMESINRFMELYSWQFDVFMCLTNCFTTCAVWMKGDAPACCRSRQLDCNNCGFSEEEAPNALRKRKAFNTRRQQWFQKSIEQRFASRMKFDCDDQDEEDPDEEEYEAEFWSEKFLEQGGAMRRAVSRLKQKRFPLANMKVSETTRSKCRSGDIVDPYDVMASSGDGDFCDVYNEKFFCVTKWARKRGF